MNNVIISRTKAVELIKQTKGSFFTVCFTKKNGEERVLNGNVKVSDFQDALGYIKVKESGKKHRLINPRTILWLRTGGKTYTIK